MAHTDSDNEELLFTLEPVHGPSGEVSTVIVSGSAAHVQPFLASMPPGAILCSAIAPPLSAFVVK